MYTPKDPYNKGFLATNSKEAKHMLFFSESGKADGLPVIFLHGGPGGGTSHATDASYFDPDVYRVVLLDQRGSGLSTPSASIVENTTWDLVADIELLREHLKIETWHLVFGGSWGSTLSLAYAQSYPDRVKHLILRGIFTLRKSELDFFYQNGASHLFPDAYDDYIAPIPEEERSNMMLAYSKRLTSEDEAVRITAAKAWSKWEMMTSKLRIDPKDVEKAEGDVFALAFARIENHYFMNEGWLRDGQLLEKQSIDKIRHIPTIVVQGRYDVVCPMKSAWDLKKVFPESELIVVPDAGHSAREVPTMNLLCEAADRVKVK